MCHLQPTGSVAEVVVLGITRQKGIDMHEGVIEVIRYWYATPVVNTVFSCAECKDGSHIQQGKWWYKVEPVWRGGLAGACDWVFMDGCVRSDAGN